LNIASTKTVPSGPTGAKNTHITVVGGAGHAGIPLVLAFAGAGLTLNINDLNETAPATLRSGTL
jgi:UDP-N-acetyl-D-mannosaminuronic acid dehydrogenase